MRLTLFALAAAFGAAGAAPAAAEDLAALIARCAAIKADILRLACFDAIGRAAPAPKPGWAYGLEKDPISDRVTEWVAREAEAPGGARLTIALRCQDAQLTLLFVTDDLLGYAVGSGLAPTVRFDEGPPAFENLTFLSERHLWFGGIAQERAFLGRVLNAKRLAMRYHDRRGDRELTAVFAIEGLRKAAAKFGGRCSLPPATPAQ